MPNDDLTILLAPMCSVAARHTHEKLWGNTLVPDNTHAKLRISHSSIAPIFKKPAMRELGQLTKSISVIVLLLSFDEASAGQTRQSVGLAVARRICSECHAVERKGGASPLGDAPSFRSIANAREATAEFLAVEIRREHEMMPNVTLNTQELRNVIAYILSLRRSR